MLSLKLALKNYRREWLFSLCAVFSLAAFMVPLLTLMGFKDGIIGTMTRRLVSNPFNLQITPVSGTVFKQDFFENLAALPDTAFLIPETRTISAKIQLITDRDQQWLDMKPTAAGDPLLAQAVSFPETGLKDDMIFISESVGDKLGLKAGDRVSGLVSRNREGRRERDTVDLTVTGILPGHIIDKDMVYTTLPLLEATEDYRNGYAVPLLAWPGVEKPPIRPFYVGFRLYAKDFDGVERLRRRLVDQGLEVNTQAREIATVRSLDQSFSVVFLVLALVVGGGAFASASSSALDQVAKMRRSLAVLRLLGFNTGRLLAFSMSQAALTGLLAALIADGLFLIIAAVLNGYFAASLGFGERICWLAGYKLAASAAISLVFMLAASATAGLSLAGIEPSEGMRDV